MAQTPEGKVKAVVSALLKDAPDIYYFMPVQGGFGASTIDYLGCHKGRFFGIETKAPGEKPTVRQQLVLAFIKRAGGKTFLIDAASGASIDELRKWLNPYTPPNHPGDEMEHP